MSKPFLYEYSRGDKERLYDVLDACERIAQHTADGVRDDKTFDAVMYRIAVIGEATTHISDDLRGDTYHDIPWVEIRGMRNILVHEYAGVSEKKVWEVVENDLPALKATVERIIVEMEKDDGSTGEASDRAE